MKNDKGHVPSPLSATQSPSAVPSPHGSEGGRRPSSRKSSDAGSHKSQVSGSYVNRGNLKETADCCQGEFGP